MSPFSNIFNRIRGNRRRGVQPLPQGLPETPLPETSPLAEAQPIGSVIPQGTALTNIQAREIPEAIPERQLQVGTPITQLTQQRFNQILGLMVEDDRGYHRNQPLNYTRFRRALRTDEGRRNLYQTFLSSSFALLNDNTQTDETRLREFYNNYRGGVNIPDILTARARLRELDAQGILEEEDVLAYHRNFN